MKKIVLFLIAVLLLGGIIVNRGINKKTGEHDTVTTVRVEPGMSVRKIASVLEEQGIVYSADILARYLAWKNLDTDIQHGDVTFEPPHTIARVAAALTVRQSAAEREITILPGWNLNDIAAYLEEEGITTRQAFFQITGEPAVRGSGGDADIAGYGLPLPQRLSVLTDKPDDVSYEGYLRPDTYRIFASSNAKDIVQKLVLARHDQFSAEMWEGVRASGRSVHEIMTMASIIEREVRTPQDRRLVSDLFWRRYDAGMGLQADSTVHYLTGTDGSVFTSAKDRDIDSPWNTYKYAGLPPGPISNPSLSAIEAAIFPESNEYWYFLTTLDTGEVKYGRTLAEHNANVQKYLR